MSTYKKGRNTKMIGVNIRKGVTPGGFSVVLGTGRSHHKKSGSSCEDIRAAASDYLRKKGVVQGPFEFGITAINARQAPVVDTP